MFDPSPSPRVFALPPGADFAQAFIDGLLARLDGSGPTALARMDIIVNTRRMERRLTELFSRDGAALLPRITPVADLAERFPAPGHLPPRPPMRRKLELMQLVSALLAARPELAPSSAAAALTDSLCALFDELQAEGVDPAKLSDLHVPNAADQWQDSLAFLRIIIDYLASRDDGAADAGARQFRAVEALIARWRDAPPEHPVLVIGSTGSRAATLNLMDAVSRLPQGALVLPGYDDQLPDEVWVALQNSAASDEHPQARFARLFSRLDIDAKSVAPWHEVSVPADRNKLVSLALRPAPVTHAWLREGPGLGDLVSATDGVELIHAPAPRIEAQAIALRLRAALDAGQTAALVTPDRVLTRQVTAALGRWGIEPDDSAGRPLSLSAPGRLLLHIASAFGAPIGAKDLIVVLKHPLTHTATADRGEHLRLTRELELWLRRKACVYPSSDDLAKWAEKRDTDAQVWARWVAKLAVEIAAIQRAELPDLVTALTSIAETIAAGPSGEGTGELWLAKAGEEAQTALSELADDATAGGSFAPSEFTALIASILSAREVRDPLLPHPGVMIWGTLEARVQGADLVILGGLNEGVWPEQPRPDPWLNRKMRSDVGLQSLERRIGLSAHDFQQAIAARSVVLSRATRDDEAATVPSRWLNRLLNLVGGLPDQGGKEAIRAMTARGDAWVSRAIEIDRHAPEPASASPRPSPRPPAEARPRELSVTEISKLIRDPYAIYARRVLGLGKIDPLDRQPDYAIRGTVLHKVVEEYLRADIRADAETAHSQLMAIADRVFERDVVWPEIRRLWRARFASIAEKFLEGERVRQAAGSPYPPEIKCEFSIEAPQFLITGKADRIDRLKDGRLAIYDYKSGGFPSPKEMEHFEKQLPVEAVIAEAGGFMGVPAAEVAEIGYIALSPSRADRSFQLVEDKDFDFRTATVLGRLKSLLASYLASDRGFTSRRAMHKTSFDGDYDHLARYGEWDDSDTPVPGDVG